MPKVFKADRRPTLTIAFGRQRVGKTVLLNTMAQFYRERGCPVQVWNADQQNRSHSLSSFFHDAKTVPDGGLDDGKAWIEARFEEMVATRCDAVLDIGGGATSFARLAAEVPLLAASAASGIRIIGMFVTGPEKADLDYLEQFSTVGSLPDTTAVVMNEGLISSERSAAFAYASVLQHHAVEAVVARGGETILFPVMTCMSRVCDLGIGFVDASNGGTSPGKEPLGMFDRMRVNRWWTREVPAFFGKLPQEWLPSEVRDNGPVDPQGALTVKDTSVAAE